MVAELFPVGEFLAEEPAAHDLVSTMIIECGRVLKTRMNSAYHS